MKICSLFGHRKMDVTAELKNKIENQIIYAIKNLNIDTFYIGQNGIFDYTCAGILAGIKQKYKFVKSCLIISYLSKKYSGQEKKYINEKFDSVIYPPIENVLPKFAINKRNEWIVKNSDYLIFFVEHNWGGAYNAMQIAKQKNKKIINLAE